MREKFYKKFYEVLNREEIIRLTIEEKKRADRNAKLLDKSINKNRELIEEKDKEIERLNNIIKEVREIFKDYGDKEDIVGYTMYNITGEMLIALLDILDKEN